MHSLQFRACSGRKDSHDRKPAGAVPHWPLRQNRQMTNDRSRPIKQGNAEIALDPPLVKAGVVGKELADLFRMIRELAVQDCFAGSTCERELEVVHETSASPNGSRPKPRTISQKFGGEGVLAMECQREVLDERIEEAIARFRFNPRDDLSQRRVVRRGFGRGFLRTHQRENSAPFGLITDSSILASDPP